MNIALDYDDTVTRDMGLFTMFALNAVKRGHKVYIVTMRYPEECSDIPEDILGIVTELCPTSRQGKQKFMLDKGIHIHVWIDDNPKAVYMDAQQAFGYTAAPGQILHHPV